MRVLGSDCLRRFNYGLDVLVVRGFAVVPDVVVGDAGREALS